MFLSTGPMSVVILNKLPSRVSCCSSPLVRLCDCVKCGPISYEAVSQISILNYHLAQ